MTKRKLHNRNIQGLRYSTCMCVNMACVQFYNAVFVLGGFWAVGAEAMSLTAEEGEKLEIQCSHSNAFDNYKYFCKGVCEDSDVLIRSNEEDPTGRYRLRDQGNTFYVTISDLRVDDSGVYWCAVERVGLDTYNKVVITVTPRTVENSQSNSFLQHMASSPEKLIYIGASLGTLLLLLIIAVLIFFKHRHRNISKATAGGEDNDTILYATPLNSTQKPSRDTTISCSPANQSSELDLLPVQQEERGIRLEPTCDIYANIQVDSVHYSSVHVGKRCLDAHTTETATYSAVKHTPAHESTIYSDLVMSE